MSSRAKCGIADPRDASVVARLNARVKGRENPVVIFGGLVSSTLLDTLLTPLMFWLWGEKPLKRLLADRSAESF